MKRIIIMLFCTAFIISCKKEVKIDYVLLDGNIVNSDAKTLKVSGNGFSQELNIAEGKVSDTLRIQEDGFYNLRIGRESTAMYLSQGDQISFNIDTGQFSETITYTGVGADANNYLAKKMLLKESTLGETPTFYALEENDFVAKSNEFVNNVKEMMSSSNLTDDFKEIEAKNLSYDHTLHLNNYENYHRHFAKKDSTFHASEALLSEVKTIALDNDVDYKNSSSYRSLVSSNFFNALSDSYETTNDYGLAFIEAAKGITNQFIKNDILKSNADFAIAPNENLKTMYDFFIENSTNDEHKESFTKIYDDLKQLTKGNPSPQFNYENFKGGSTSLADLKGKLVYVDVWATWCGPCKREIPFLKEVEEEFHGKDVEFVSISIDTRKDYEKWKTMVADKELGGIQLFADKDWTSDFVTAYKITGIPRFILIDREGNIISADAPRPSNPVLKEKLNKLLNNKEA